MVSSGRPRTASLVAVALLAGLLWTPSTAGAETTPSSLTALPFLHVVVPTSGPDRTPYLADPANRQMLLRGVAAVGMEDVAYAGADGGPALFPVNPSAYNGACPKASALIPQPPLCEVEASKPAYQQSTAPGSGDDFAQMRALGFNVVRLVLNWSQLEPTAGNYSTSFVNRVAQVVSWARQQGIYVILDMHQDQYSRYILPSKPATTPAGCKPSGGSDGAPPWAVMSDGKPGCALAGIDELNPAEAAAFSNFWTNVTVPSPKGSAPGPGLEDHYIGAMAALAHRFESDPAVLGYEIMNEPQPGSTADLPVANAYQSSAQELYPFYTRAIEALTGVRDGKPTCPATSPTSLSGACAYPQLANVSRQQIFFEPLAYRNLVDFSMQVSAPFSSYKNLVFAPHVYTYAFTIEQELLGAPPGGGGYPPNFTFGYQTAESEAQAMHAAVFSTEFGDSASTDKTIVSKEVAAQEATLTGGTLWAWKGLSKQAATCWCVRWQFSTYETTSNGTAGVGDPHTTPSPDDRVIASRQITMDRVWPRATAGLLGAYRYDPAGRSFAMVASAVTSVHRGDRAAETVVYIPATVDGAVAAAGNATLDVVLTQPDGSRLAYVAPEIPSHKSPASGARFTYTVTVGHATSALRNSVAQAAADPPPPIAEPQARALSEQALHAALTSTNPKIRSTAQLVNVLAGLVLGSTDPNDPGSTPAG